MKKHQVTVAPGEVVGGIPTTLTTASCSCGEWEAEGWWESSVRSLAANHEAGTDTA